MQADFLFSPPGPGIIAAFAILIAFVISRVRNKPVSGWNSAAVILVLYAFVNVAFGFFAVGFWEYLLFSVGIFVILYFCIFIFAPPITGKSYHDYGDNAMLLVAPVIVYGVLLFILGMIRAFY